MGKGRSGLAGWLGGEKEAAAAKCSGSRTQVRVQRLLTISEPAGSEWAARDFLEPNGFDATVPPFQTKSLDLRQDTHAPYDD